MSAEPTTEHGQLRDGNHELRWWQPGPFAYSSWELWFVRIGFALLFFWNTKWETAQYKTQPNPNGIANWVDLTWLGHHPPGMMAKGLVIAALGMYVAGLFPALGLLPAVFFSICIGTLINSQGEIQHSWQLVTLAGLAQFAVYAWPRGLADAETRRRGDKEKAASSAPTLSISPSQRRRVWHLFFPSASTHRLAVYAGTVVIAGGYVVCGLVKLINSDFQWIQKVPLLAVQLLKTNWANYYDTLEQPPQWLQQAAQLIIEHPHLARVFFGAGLALELFAFVVLISRPWAFWFGLGLVSLHVGIMHVMNLTFMQHIYAVLIFLVIPNALHCWPWRAAGGS